MARDIDTVRRPGEKAVEVVPCFGVSAGNAVAFTGVMVLSRRVLLEEDFGRSTTSSERREPALAIDEEEVATLKEGGSTEEPEAAELLEEDLKGEER